jgi:FAD/FMN-containing dehydrogenase/ferredoxin
MRYLLHTLGGRANRVSAEEAEAWADDLRSRLSPDAIVTAGQDERKLHRRDRGELPRGWARRLVTCPGLMLKPASPQDVAAAVQWAHERHLPVVPRGLATTGHGEALPTCGGLLVDLAQFNRIGPLDPQAQTVQVQAGVTWGDLEVHLAELGLALYTYPASRFSTVGGWVSTGGLGINAFGYGHLRRWVAGLRIVTAGGQQRTLTRRDNGFDAFFGAEGMMGVVTEVTLRLRPAPSLARSHLFYFDSTRAQLGLVRHLIACKASLAHVKLYDRRYMAFTKALYTEAHPDRTPFYEEREAVLIHVDAEAQERALEDALAHADFLVEEAPPYAAGTLWHLRFYPLALKRYGPDLLTAPVVMPLAQTADFIDDAMHMAGRFGLEGAVETTIAAAEGGDYEALVVPLFPCNARRHSYPFHVLLAHLVTRAAVKHGGRPYATGVLNGPFAQEVGLFNPRRLKGPAALLFWPPMFCLALNLAGAFAPQVGRVARCLHRPEQPPALPPRPRHRGRLTNAELEATIRTCTSCGNCVPVCPAYLITRDETTTGRAKLQTGLLLLQGEEVSRVRADKTFLCMYCKACQDVCEAELPLLAAYAAIEERLAERYGRPDELIARFIAEAESSADYLHFVGTTPLPAPEPEDEEPRRDGNGRSRRSPSAVGMGLRPALSRRAPIGPFSLVRSEHCVNCGQCARVCPYAVHRRRPEDLRRMAQPISHLCVGCFRCVQECPTRALTLMPSPAYQGLGRGIYTAETVLRLSRQAETGKDDATGRLYSEDTWLDVSQVIRPPGDVLAGESAVTLGRRLERLQFSSEGKVISVLPPAIGLSLPVVLALPPGAPETLNSVLVRTARQLGTLALMDWADWQQDWQDCAPWIALRVSADHLEEARPVLPALRLLAVDGLEGVIAHLRTRHAHLALAAEVPLDRRAPEAALELVRVGADVIFLNGDNGLCTDRASDVADHLPPVHWGLTAISRRDRASLVARGDIATAEGMAMAMMLGADAVVVDWPLLIALECRLQDGCAKGAHVCGIKDVDPSWAEQRLVNLLGAWRGQLLAMMAVLGLRHAHHLRGVRGRGTTDETAGPASLGRLHRMSETDPTPIHLLRT